MQPLGHITLPQNPQHFTHQMAARLSRSNDLELSTNTNIVYRFIKTVMRTTKEEELDNSLIQIQLQFVNMHDQGGTTGGGEQRSSIYICTPHSPGQRFAPSYQIYRVAIDHPSVAILPFAFVNLVHGSPIMARLSTKYWAHMSRKWCQLMAVIFNNCGEMLWSEPNLHVLALLLLPFSPLDLHRCKYLTSHSLLSHASNTCRDNK